MGNSPTSETRQSPFIETRFNRSHKTRNGQDIATEMAKLEAAIQSSAARRALRETAVGTISGSDSTTIR
ncbi:hypothetical protein CCP3SC15_440017 [Gammaproteobacteria bacterium]